MIWSKDNVEKAYGWINFCREDSFMSKGIEEAKQSAVMFNNLDYEETIKLLSGAVAQAGLPTVETKHIVTQQTIEEVLAEHEEPISVLCYADYTKAGGKFLEGAFAQEEALCHCTGLYSILEEKFLFNYFLPHEFTKNKGQYDHSFLILEVPYYVKGKYGKTYMIYSAAPNFRQLLRYGCKESDEVTFSTMQEAMRQRQELAYLMAATTGVRTFVAGPWGCGVFKNDPNLVAKNWLDIEKKYPGIFKEIIHTCPGKNTNYNVFKRILG